MFLLKCCPLQSAGGYRIVQVPNGASVSFGGTRSDLPSRIGPVAEAEALYVRQLDLARRMRGHDGDFVIWDVGLGAAANVLTVLRHTREIPCPVRMVRSTRLSSR